MWIEKSAEGKSIKNAKQTAEKIKYNVKIENKNLILDNYINPKSLSLLYKSFKAFSIICICLSFSGTKFNTPISKFLHESNPAFLILFSMIEYLLNCKLESEIVLLKLYFSLILISYILIYLKI
mgnify:CR=1 FL=1